MALPPEITAAVQEAVREAGQPEHVATKITRWLDALSSGQESINETESVQRHLDVIFESLDVRLEDESSETEMQTDGD